MTPKSKNDQTIIDYEVTPIVKKSSSSSPSMENNEG